MSGKDQGAAVSDTAHQQHVPADKVQKVFNELGGSDLLGKAESFGKGLFG